MKGIILAGGSGTRLYPLTKGQSKQLLAIHDKPMIYYPLSVLMLAGITEILIISTPNDLPNFKRLFKDSSKLGLKISFEEQKNPNGIAEALIIGEKFVGNSNICLILGDNIFYGAGFTELLKKSVNEVEESDKAIVFGYYVDNAQSYGVIEKDRNGNVLSIEEKPKSPKSNFAVVGLYFYPNSVINIAKKIEPSKRGELEITSVNESYLTKKKLKVTLLDKDFTWLDSGTHNSMLEASNFVHTIEKRNGRKVACIEEIAFNKGYINSLEFTSEGKYILKVLDINDSSKEPRFFNGVYVISFDESDPTKVEVDQIFLMQENYNEEASLPQIGSIATFDSIEISEQGELSFNVAFGEAQDFCYVDQNLSIDARKEEPIVSDAPEGSNHFKIQKQWRLIRVDAQSGGNGETTSISDPLCCLLYTSPSPRDKRQSRMAW